MQTPFTDKNFWSSHLMEEVDEHVRKIYPEIPHSGYVAQSVNNFLYPGEKEMESAENSITLDKNDNSKHTSTTTTIDGTSISSAFCIELSKLFCCSSAL